MKRHDVALQDPPPPAAVAPLSPFVHALAEREARAWHLPRPRQRRGASEPEPRSPALAFGPHGTTAHLELRAAQDAPIVTSSATSPPLTVRRALERAGGLAGAAWLADELQRETGEPLSVRMVRDRFRNIGSHVRKLGAGYYALKDHPAPPLPRWAAWWVHARGPCPVADLVEAILKAYPNGDPRAVHAWLHQEPSPLVVTAGRVHIVTSRRPA